MRKLILCLFILSLFPLVFGASTFMDNPDDFFIMPDIVTPPTPVTPPTAGGGSVKITPECVNDSDCDLGEFCFENKCYAYECETDADCNETKTCWMHRCVKLFDMKIIDVESPIYPGNFFEFTYYLKGVAAIHGDVVVNFWLVRDGEVVTEGFDTIYMADFDETTETTELFLPKTILPGVYNFYAEVNYDSYYARAGRIIGVEEIPEELRPGLVTGKAIADVGDVIKTNLSFILVIVGILVLFGIIYWERKELDKALISERRWLRRHKVSIGTFLFFVVLVGVLFYATKAGLIKLPPLQMSFVKYIYLIGVFIVLLVILSRARIGEMLISLWEFFKGFFGKRRKLEVSKEAKPRIKKVAVKPKVKHVKEKKVGRRKGRDLLRSAVSGWRKKGYDTDSLHEEPKKLGQKRMGAWLEKWRKKGYDIGSISERGFKEKSE